MYVNQEKTSKDITIYYINKTDMLDTVVGHNLSYMFLENIAFNIADVLEEREPEKEATAKRKVFCETLTHYALKGT